MVHVYMYMPIKRRVPKQDEAEQGLHVQYIM